MEQPKRIASLLASATEILYGIGAGDCVVAVSHECDFPPEVKDKPRVTFSHIDVERSSREIDQQVQQMCGQNLPLYKIDGQRLRQLAPQLIVTQQQCDVCAVKYQDVLDLVESDTAFRETQVVALNPVSLEEIFADILRVGRAAGREAAAEQFSQTLRQRVEAVANRTSQLAMEQRPRVACIEWIEPLMLAGNWMPRLVELAGGQNGLTVADQHSTYHAWEDVAAYDPEVLIISPCGFDLARTAAEARPLSDRAAWRDLSAVRHDRVYLVDGNAYFNRSGPRIVDSLEILAALVHPEKFPLSPQWLGQVLRPFSA